MASDATNIGFGFKVWGTDNMVYGPVELPTLVEWIKDERVTNNTWIFSEKGDCWHKAEQTPELQLFFNRKPASDGASAAGAAVPPAALRRVKILAELSDADLARFLTYMEVQTVRQWNHVVKQGEDGDAMFLVLQGEVRVALNINGKESTLVTLGPGDFFGEVALFDSGPRSADVVANSDVTLLKISQSAFATLTQSAPDLAAPILVGIGKTLTARIRADNKRYRDSVTFARAAR